MATLSLWIPGPACTWPQEAAEGVRGGTFATRDRDGTAASLDGGWTAPDAGRARLGIDAGATDAAARSMPRAALDAALPFVAELTMDDAGGEPGFAPSDYACPAGRAFCEVTAEAGLRDQRGYGRGAAFVDVDGDGWDDLFVADTDARLRGDDYAVSRIYRNLGNGHFEPLDVGFAEGDVHGNWVGAFADYDNDGDPDVLLASGGYTFSSTLALYENRMREQGRFVDVTQSAGLAPHNAMPHPWWGATWADYDGDGLLDAAVTRREGQPLLLHNEGDGTFSERAASLGVVLANVANPDIKNPVFLDFDADGDMDLYIAGIGVHGLFENRGASGFVDVTVQAFGNEPIVTSPYVFAAAVTDLDQDGKDDLYLGRWDRQDLLMRNLGGGAFEALGPELGLVTTLHGGASGQAFENTMGLGIGDLFDDGQPDVFIGTGDPLNSAPDVMFCNQGAGVLTRCSDLFDDPFAPGLNTRGHAIVFADVDHDGDTDVFRNLGGHPPIDMKSGADSREYNRLFVSAAEGLPTAAITLQGVRSNRDAIGAHVQVHSTPPRFHGVHSTQAFQAQNSRTLTLRLDDSGATAVSVRWPGGLTSELTLTPGQRLQVFEPAQ